MKAKCTSRVSVVLFVLAFTLFDSPPLHAQDSSSFARQGCVELGGSISYLSTTSIYNGIKGTPITVITVQPFFGFFAADGFELGLDPLGITSMSAGGASTTEYMIFLAPSYNFKTKGKAFPFIEGLVGYTAVTSSGTASGLSWGGRIGLKFPITDKGLLNFGIQYMQITLDPSESTERNGMDNFSISAGFTVWI